MKQPMRNRVERFVVLPFTIAGCSSESSVAVASSSCQTSKKLKSESRPYAKASRRQRGQSGQSGDIDHHHYQRPRSSLPNFFNGVQKLIAGSFKSVSQIFVYRDELEEVEMEMEMEIGFPTDVKHVTHIGLDGSTTTNPVKGRTDANNNLLAMSSMAPAAGPEILSFPASAASLSLRRFELTMAAQASDNGQYHHPSSYYLLVPPTGPSSSIPPS